ncbi:uncharacterized protein LOC134647520 [Cydia amplana]|uniref:uncharacterized protein LOC134647520 n=1 Tax=Cydia amplana TaxID=1869771 RepID=UPI002FE5605B
MGGADETKTDAAELTAPATEVMAISVSSRIPDFWVDQPRVWFIRTEAVLTPQKIGDDAKFDMVVSKLPKEVILRLTDFLTKPPETNKYQALKSKLLTTLEDSKNRQIEKVLSEMDLGDQKPSHLLVKMRNLAKGSFPDDTLRIMWQNHLPTIVRAVLVASRETDLDTLANIADEVAEATKTHVAVVETPTHSAARRTSPRGSGAGDTAVILAEIAKLSVRMMDLERSRPRIRNFGRRGRGGRSASRPRSISRHHSKARKPDWLCYYHFRFGTAATKCRQPCAWTERQSENQ